jgi:DUF917 family protein
MKQLLDEPALRALARGCAVLGTGGGGDSRIGLLQAMQAAQEFGPTELLDLDELPSDALIMPCGVIGAPTVAIEKIGNGNEGVVLRDHLEQITGGKVAALMAAEIGGSNGLLPAAGPAGAGCRSWTPTAWAGLSLRFRRSLCTWRGSRRVRT